MSLPRYTIPRIAHCGTGSQTTTTQPRYMIPTVRRCTGGN